MIFPPRTSQLLYTVTQEKSTGPNLEEDPNQTNSEHKPVSDSATKILTEEKTKLEEQLKEITVRILAFLPLYPLKKLGDE